MSSFCSTLKDIKKRKHYNLNEILDSKLFDIFGMNYDELTAFFNEIEIVTQEEVVIYLLNNVFELKEFSLILDGNIADANEIYGIDYQINFITIRNKAIEARLDDYDYYIKYIEMLKSKGLELLRLLEYLSLNKNDDKIISDIMNKLEIILEEGVSGKIFINILKDLFYTYNDLKIIVDKINSCQVFKNQFIIKKRASIIDYLYSESSLLGSDKTSIRKRLF